MRVLGLDKNLHRKSHKFLKLHTRCMLTNDKQSAKIELHTHCM